MISSSPFDIILRIKLWEIKNDFFSFFSRKISVYFASNNCQNSFRKKKKITFPQTISIFTLNHPFYYHLRISRHSKGIFGIDYSFAHQNSNRSGTRLPRCFVKSREKRERVLFSIYEARFPRRVFPFYHGPSFEQTYSPIFSQRGTAKLALPPSPLLSPLLRVITRKRAPSCVP